MEIVIGRTVDTSALFAGESDMDGVDVQASAEAFDSMLVERVASAFPEATVTIGDGSRIYDDTVEGDANPFGTNWANEANNTISQIVDDITNQSDEWIVEA